VDKYEIEAESEICNSLDLDGDSENEDDNGSGETVQFMEVII
jgi:hypothetical protein